MNFTVCPFCSCGCRMAAGKPDQEGFAGLVPVRTHPVTRGSLCIRGWNSHEYVRHEDRLSTPLVKGRDGQRESSWEEAIQMVSDGLNEVIRKWGPESIAFLGSTRCSNEDNYLFMRMAREVVKTAHLDTSSRLTHFPVLDAFYEGLGTGSATATLDQIPEADFILIAGADLSGSCPQGLSRVLEAMNRKAEVAVIDPRATRMAKMATYHLRPDPGSDLYWINAMIAHLIEAGNIDGEFVQGRTRGYAEFRKGVAGFSPALSEKMTGIPAGLLEVVSEHMAGAERAVIIAGTGLSGAPDIKAAALGLSNLALISGHAGRTGSGIIVTGGNNNTQGAWDMGVLPNRTSPGNPVKEGPSAAGKDYEGILQGVLSGEIRALYLMGEDPLAGGSGWEELERALSRLELLAVQDLFPSKTTSLASVVFPSSGPYERGGTFTNLERRVQRFDPVLERWGNGRPDWEIIGAVSRAMGADFGFREVFEITDQIASEVSSYRGITAAALEQSADGITWVSEENGEPGEPWLAEMWKGEFRSPPTGAPDRAERSEEYPFLLIPGRFPSFWNTGRRSSRIQFLAREEVRSAIEMNPEDAGKAGLREGARVRVDSLLGSVETSVSITEDLPRGSAHLPLHEVDGKLQGTGRRIIPVRIEPC